MNKYTIAVIGCGSRGASFAQNALAHKDKYDVVSFCDISEEQIAKTKKLCGIDDIESFLDVDKFFEKKRADVLVIATPDRDHVPQAVKALNLGYDILLEKPVSDSREELKLLSETQKKTGKKIFICHELRYGFGYRKCGEILKSGKLGRLYSIDASERVWYAHWVQAYVRGIGASIERGHPAILAKCSHDLDLIQSYAGSKCVSVSSVGDLGFFIPENAPEGATERCLDCKHQDTCVYSAKKIYIDLWYEWGKPDFRWPFNKVTLTNPHTEESIRKGLREGEYGICAFKCKVDKVDHQLVQMNFENGVKASLKMVYGAEAGRKIIFYCTYGEMIFDERSNDITVMVFGKEPEVIRIDDFVEDARGHGGGDEVLVMEMYDMLTGAKECDTTLDESLESHLMGIAADESRKLGGALIKVHED